MRNHAAPSSGFTIMEVMAATFVLCIGLVSVLGHYIDLQSTRRQTKETARVQDIVRALAERAISADPRVLGTKDAKWSYARFVDDVASDHPPMIDDPNAPDDDLSALGVVDAPTGVPGLKIYFEYYQGTTGMLLNGTTSKPGLLDSVPLTAGDFRELFSNSPVFRQERRLEPGPAFANINSKQVKIIEDGEMNLMLQLNEEDVFIVHVVANWDHGHFDVFAGTRRTRSIL